MRSFSFQGKNDGNAWRDGVAVRKRTKQTWPVTSRSLSRRKKMSKYRQMRKEKKVEKATPQAALFGCVYVAILAAVAFLISGFLMQQFDLYDELGIGVVDLPLVNTAVEIPEWALQVAMTVLIFFFLQPFAVILLGMLGLRKTEEEPSQSPQGRWQR
jgi:hypothetical protein